jgi:hypothetical protein
VDALYPPHHLRYLESDRLMVGEPLPKRLSHFDVAHRIFQADPSEPVA